MVELPRGDWAITILRQFFIRAYQQLLFLELQNSKDEQVAAIAAKSLKEVDYHVRWSAEWVIRLGDGTEESQQRMRDALDTVWPYSGELFIAADYEIAAAKEGIGIDPSGLQDRWINKVQSVFDEALLQLPSSGFMQTGGKQGMHTEHMGYILTDLQYLQRTYPGAEW